MLALLLSLSTLPLLVPLPQEPAEAAARGAKAPATNRIVAPKAWAAIVAEGKTRSQVMEHLDHLVNRIGPRLTSSDNLTNACEWARDTFKSFGIENARLEQWGTFPVGFNRGPWSGELLGADGGREALEFITRAWTVGTKGREVGVALIMPKTLDAAKELGDSLEGGWILGNPGGGRFRRQGSAPKEVVSYLEEAGIRGFVSSSANRFNTNKKYESLLITGGSYRVKLASMPKLPRITLRKDQYASIAKRVADGEELRLAFDIRNHVKKGPIPLYNVIADIVGSEHPDEFVVVGGHIDSWDGATGTTDNGTGCATTIEAARILMACGIQPKRSIRFMLWSGEEQGLMGSNAYVKKHRSDGLLDRISAVLVHDGGTNYISGIQAMDEQRPYIAEAMAGVSSIDEDFGFKVLPLTNFVGGSDHASFQSAGVPGYFWNQAGKADYTWTHHTQYDTYDMANEAYQEQTATVAALGALAIANLPELLPRIDMKKFRSLRGRRGGRNRLRFGVSFGDGLVVEAITKDSLAAKAGLKKGDKVLSFGGEKCEDRMSFMIGFFRFARSSEKKAKLVVLRGGKKVEIDVDRPVMPARGGQRRGRQRGEGRRGEAPNSERRRRGL